MQPCNCASIKQSVNFTEYHQIYANLPMISWPWSCVSFAWRPGLHAAVPPAELLCLTTQLLLYWFTPRPEAYTNIVFLVPWLSSGFVLLRIRSYCSVEFAYWTHVQSSDVLQDTNFICMHHGDILQCPWNLHLPSLHIELPLVNMENVFNNDDFPVLMHSTKL